jgi:hypothetical protein
MPFARRGRPGLLGTVARTAIVAGTATATANAVDRRASARMAEQQNAAAFVAQQGSGGADPPAGAPPAETGDLVSRLTELARLRDGGFLSEAEFDVAKGRLLSS